VLSLYNDNSFSKGQDKMSFSNKVDQLREKLATHPLYDAVQDAVAVRQFMRAHVFCVWDFQSILKTLQGELTTVTVPWLPSHDPEARRLINEIVLEEESDIHPDGGYTSHYEFYLEAMHECGADTRPIEQFIGGLDKNTDILTHIYLADLPNGVAQFMHTTFDVLLNKPLHCKLALFAYSREDMIPDMFVHLVESLNKSAGGHWQKFLYYLNRHIEVDGERHGPISQALLARECGDDEIKWQQAEQTLIRAFESRIALWDSILADFKPQPLSHEAKS
jgi:pyrroloquinoline quinone (PQQ) biosynthesis protein C